MSIERFKGVVVVVLMVGLLMVDVLRWLWGLVCSLKVSCYVLEKNDEKVSDGQGICYSWWRRMKVDGWSLKMKKKEMKWFG